MTSVLLAGESWSTYAVHTKGANPYTTSDHAEGAEVLAAARQDPLLVVASHEKGRTAAFTSDCAPHWGRPDSIAWSGYPQFWSQLITWLGEGAH